MELTGWYGDRLAIAEKAIADTEDEGVVLLTLDDGDELVGIATIRDSELLNLATKHGGHGYGVAMLEKIAEYAIENDTYINGLSTDEAVFFYCQNGWEIEGYPGDNLGIPIYWPQEQIARFLSDERAEMLTEAAELTAEYRGECEV